MRVKLHLTEPAWTAFIAAYAPRSGLLRELHHHENNFTMNTKGILDSSCEIVWRCHCVRGTALRHKTRMGQQ